MTDEALIRQIVKDELAKHEKKHHRRRGKLKIVEPEEPYFSNLDAARRLWPSKRKQGAETEWLNFVSKHANYKELLDDLGLRDCVVAMIREGLYSDGYWPSFSKFVNQSLWEQVLHE